MKEYDDAPIKVKIRESLQQGASELMEDVSDQPSKGVSSEPSKGVSSEQGRPLRSCLKKSNKGADAQFPKSSIEQRRDNPLEPNNGRINVAGFNLFHYRAAILSTRYSFLL